MKPDMKFDKNMISKLKYYIYLYIDPDTGEIFYVGKGKGNRAFSHLKDTSDPNPKLSEKIKEIRNKGKNKEPKIEILLHGISDEILAKKVEASVIDLLNVNKLTNKVRGYQAGIYGRMNVLDLISLYSQGQEEVDIDKPSILIRINKLYRYGLDAHQLYDITRGIWKVNIERAKKAKLAFAVYGGIIKEVYEIKEWFQAGSTFSFRDLSGRNLKGRYEFVGRIANPEDRTKYINKSVGERFKKGDQNPIRYVGC